MWQLAGRGLIKGRDHLMWVLLQFISGSIQKNALADFLPVMKLFDLLYPEKEVREEKERERLLNSSGTLTLETKH